MPSFDDDDDRDQAGMQLQSDVFESTNPWQHHKMGVQTTS